VRRGEGWQGDMGGCVILCAGVVGVIDRRDAGRDAAQITVCTVRCAACEADPVPRGTIAPTKGGPTVVGNEKGRKKRKIEGKKERRNEAGRGDCDWRGRT
jgi:hypothetical protein